MKITALGTQGWIPTQQRAGLSTAVEVAGKLFIFELGTGVARLLEPDLKKELLAPYTEIHVVISHFHLDHIIGLSYLPLIASGKQIHFHSPGQLLGLKTKEVLNNVFSTPYFSSPPASWEWLASVNELKEGKQHIDGVKLSTRLQKHTGGSLGFVVNDKFAQLSDTTVELEQAQFIKNCQLLFHECWYLEETPSDDHAHLPGIITLAQKAAIPKVGLIHLNPAIPAEKYQKRIQQLNVAEKIALINDKAVFELE